MACFFVLGTKETLKKLEIWSKTLEKRRIKISRKKTEYPCTVGGREQEENIILQDIHVPMVSAFKYLVSTVQDDGGKGIEAGKRISAAWYKWRKITAVLCDRKVLN